MLVRTKNENIFVVSPKTRKEARRYVLNYIIVLLNQHLYERGHRVLGYDCSSHVDIQISPSEEPIYKLEIERQIDKLKREMGPLSSPKKSKKTRKTTT
jgi:hypothetical protein